MTIPATIRFALPIALLLAATTARAQSEPAPTGSYRWQATATDAAAVTAAVAGFSLEGKDRALGNVPSNAMMTIGISGYFLGAPIVHVANKHYGRAAVSLALRVGLPILGGAIGARSADCTADQFLCGLEEMGKGMMIGGAAAVVVDNLLLYALPGDDAAAEPAPVAARPRSEAGLSLTPRLAAGPNAAMLGVGGQF